MGEIPEHVSGIEGNITTYHIKFNDVEITNGIDHFISREIIIENTYSDPNLTIYLGGTNIVYAYCLSCMSNCIKVMRILILGIWRPNLNSQSFYTTVDDGEAWISGYIQLY